MHGIRRLSRLPINCASVKDMTCGDSPSAGFAATACLRSSDTLILRQKIRSHPEVHTFGRRAYGIK